MEFHDQQTLLCRLLFSHGNPFDENLKPTTHNGAKSNFTEHFIKTNRIPKKYGKKYSQLFTWRQKGDYDDLFDFDKEKVNPYFKPVLELINIIENELQK
ncbi:MAG: hypothetical protein NTW16_01865 [Bacteroidetes bacterium]|nr:hypothetical protein [Bacteroidota bacterium]